MTAVRRWTRTEAEQAAHDAAEVERQRQWLRDHLARRDAAAEGSA